MSMVASRPDPSNCIHVVSVGMFGRAVAKYLKTLFSNMQVTIWDGGDLSDCEQWPDCILHVLAAWRPVRSLCEFMDELSYERGRPFIPLILDSPVLRFGPVIVPNVSGCWHCWDMRLRQHTISLRERSALLEFYETNPQSGPAGYLEPFAMIGAAQIARITQSSMDRAAGQIWQMNLFTRHVSTGRLVGIDGCGRCGLSRPLEDRTYYEAKDSLSFLWTGHKT